MKATLEFDLNEPEDRTEHLRCVKALDMACVLFEIQRNVRKRMTTSNTPEEYEEGVEDTLNFINELIEEHGIIIDDLIN
jgi:hypothetical protein